MQRYNLFFIPTLFFLNFFFITFVINRLYYYLFTKQFCKVTAIFASSIRFLSIFVLFKLPLKQLQIIYFFLGEP